MRHITRRFESWFATFGAFLDAAFFRPAMTVEDDIAQRRPQAQKIIDMCEEQIRKAAFQQHMARCELLAIGAWEASQPKENQ